MRRTLTALAALATVTPAFAAPPAVAPPPQQLLAQADEIDLGSVDGEEETLQALDGAIIEEESWSMGAAIGLSLIPGGGFGLMYADKPGAAGLTFALAAAGYGLGAAYMLGAFDESTSQRCRFGDSSVDMNECDAAYDPEHPLNKEIDPRTGDYYFRAKDQYAYVTTGENFDGQTTGLIIMGATYATTTLLGAVWSGTAVHRHNDDVRKRVESTASIRPLLGYTGSRGYFGVGLDF